MKTKKHLNEDDYDAPELTPEMVAKARRVGPVMPGPAKLILGSPKDGVVTAKLVRGGARPGAGRKPSGRVQSGIRLLPRTKVRLAALAKQQHRSVSELADELLNSALTKAR